MTNPITVVERNDALIAGVESEAYIIDWSSEGTPSAADTFVYIKGQPGEIGAGSPTVLAATAESISGSFVTCPLLTPPLAHGGKVYVFVATATFGTRIRGVQFEIPIVSPQKQG